MSGLLNRIRQLVDATEGKVRRWGAITRFAGRIGVSQGLASDWVHGKAEPNSEHRAKICAVYGVSRKWLDRGDGQMVESEQTEIEALRAELTVTKARLEEREHYISQLVELVRDVKRRGA